MLQALLHEPHKVLKKACNRVFLSRQEKWESLLRAKPHDPMAFYWREMIQWCKNRGNGGCGAPECEEKNVLKRGCEALREGLE